MLLEMFPDGMERAQHDLALFIIVVTYSERFKGLVFRRIFVC